MLADLRPALAAEWGKAWSVRVPMLCLLAAVLVILGTAGTLASDFAYSVNEGQVPPGSRMLAVDALGPGIGFGQIVLAAFALQLVTTEYGHRTIVPTLLAQPRSSTVIMAKFLIATVVGAVVGLVVGGVGVPLVETLLGSDKITGSLSMPLSALRAGAVLAVAGGIATSIGFLVRSATGALAATFVLLVVTLTLPDRLGDWLPGLAGAHLLQGDGDAYPPAVGLLLLIVWDLALLLAAVWTTRRRDA